MRAGLPWSLVTAMSPEVCVSTPEMMLSNVLLPQPDGPTMETKVCPRTSKVMWSRTRLARGVPAPKVLQRSFTVRTAMSLPLGSVDESGGGARGGTAGHGGAALRSVGG